MTMSIHNVQNTSASASSTMPSAAPTAPLLPPPGGVMIGGDIGADIAAMTVKVGQAERDLDTKAEQTQNAVQDRAEQAEVSTLKDEAGTMRATAWESGCLQIASGVASMASAGCANGSGGAAFAKGAAEGLSGGATLAAGLGKAAGTDDDALTAAYKAASASAQRAGDLNRQAQKDAAGFIQAAIDFYREYQSGKARRHVSMHTARSTK